MVGAYTLRSVARRVSALFAFIACFSGSIPVGLGAQAVTPQSVALNLVAMLEVAAGDAFAFGTAVVVARDHDELTLITANHVLAAVGAPAPEIRVRFAFARDKPVLARILQQDPELDLAVLAVPRSGLTGEETRLGFERTRTAAALKPVEGLSGLHPVGNPNQVGWFSPRALDRFHELRGDEIIFESPSLMVGFSGGALFTEDWYLVGMLRSDDPPFGRALKIEAIAERLKAWNIPIDMTVTPLPPQSPPFKDCDICPEMVAVPAGEFLMGAEDPHRVIEFNEEPQHRVVISRPFAVSRYEITVGQFQAFVDDAHHRMGSGCKVWHGTWKWDGDKDWQDPAGLQRDDSPVVCVAWDDAKKYAKWMAEKTGKRYRLLSEAEWEYAARAGTATRYWWGDHFAPGFANCLDCGSEWDGERPAQVGRFLPNWFGIHDTQGNVWEWVEDCWHDSYDGAPADGSAWIQGGNCNRRVIRGGSWPEARTHIRAANRAPDGADNRTSGLGIRVAREMD